MEQILLLQPKMIIFQKLDVEMWLNDTYIVSNADVVELVDTLGLGPNGVKPVRVRVSPSVHNIRNSNARKNK